MIDRELFKRQMALLADRVGRELKAPTVVEYWRLLSQALTTEQYLAAMTLLIATWDAKFKTWPSPLQIVETIRPVAAPTLSASEAFEQVLAIANEYQIKPPAAKEKIQALGASTLRAYLAAGGFRELANILESNVTWARKLFVVAYEESCAHAEAEQQAHLALGDADQRLQLMASSIAQQKAMPAARKTIAAGSASSLNREKQKPEPEPVR